MTALVLTPTGLRQGARRWPCTVGRGGIRDPKREGDGATPAGRLRITGALFRPDRMARPVPWARPIGPRDLWCDDPAHPLYNRLADAPLSGSAEVLRRADRLYDLILTTDWNAAGVPGRGSAIFLHRWRRRGVPTEGCIALAPRDLLAVARASPPGTPLLIR